MVNLWLAVVGAAALVQAQDHPVIDPPMDWDRAEQDMLANMPSAPATCDDWEAGWIPEGCKDMATQKGLDPSHFSVFNVHYDDCAEPWIFCRHKDAEVSEPMMVEYFGRLPVHMRSYVRHLIGTPGLHDGAMAFTIPVGDVVSEGLTTLHVLIHEVSHQLDWHALQQFGSPFSGTDVWKDNYSQDKYSVSEYSKASWMENFAEVGLVGLYDRVVPGGIGNIQPKWQDIFHQYATYMDLLGNNILAGGECRDRVANSNPVPMSNDAKLRIRSLGPKPDVSFRSNVTVKSQAPKPETTVIYNTGSYV